MATYTDNYNLIKPSYSEIADVATINTNMNTIDDIMHSTQVSLAPAYDSTQTYNTGDVVMYELLMYKCTDDNVTGTWNASKWERTTASECGDSGGGGTDVEANPTGTATEELNKLRVGNDIYSIPSGGGGGGGRTATTLYTQAYLTANPTTITLLDDVTNYDEITFILYKKDDNAYYDYIPNQIFSKESIVDAMDGAMSGRTNVLNISGWQPISQYLRITVTDETTFTIVVNNNNLLIHKIIGIKY